MVQLPRRRDAAVVRRIQPQARRRARRACGIIHLSIRAPLLLFSGLPLPYNGKARFVEEQDMAERVEYKYLKPKPGSNYRQLFVHGRIRAEILYRETVGPEPLTPEEVASE